MSTIDLLPVLELLPEPCQEQAIISCLEGMLARRDWEAVSIFLPPICALNGHVSFKGMAMGIAVKCAIRARNYPLAIERLEMLSELGATEEILASRADALLQLAIQLLPEHPGLVAVLWRPMLTHNLQPDTQLTVGHTGFLLARAFGKNGDSESGQMVWQAMNTKLNMAVMDWLSAQLLHGRRSGG